MGLNLKTKKKRRTASRQKIIKEKAGELAHLDCHYLYKGIVRNKPDKRYYLVGVMDDCTRITWVDLVEDIQALTVMFSLLSIFNLLKVEYDIKFDNDDAESGNEHTEKSNPVLFVWRSNFGH